MILRAEGISKQFIRKSGTTNVFIALSETDFTLSEGKLTVITGRSGSGKSTLLNILSGLLSPTQVRVYLREQELYAMSDKELSILRNRHFGFIPQGQSAIFTLNVMENVLLPYSLYGEYGEGREYAKELLALMDIAELKDAMPNELSGGEMRRMTIARAMIRKPEVIFADEPTGDLDDENTEVVFSLLKQTAQKGASVLLVTHENDAYEYADEVYKMSKGVLHREK